MKRNVNTILAALVTTGLLASACSSDADPSAVDAREESDAGGFDAEGGLVDEPADEPAEEPADELASAEMPAEAPAEEPASELASDAEGELAPERTAADASETGRGGLFDDDEPQSEPEPSPQNEYRPFVDVAADPLSTFALDVDTGAYSLARRWLDAGERPPIDTVRPEEYVNAFEYDYDIPRRGLEISVDGGPSPFDDRNHLVRIGVQAEVVDERDRPPAALTFVVDTSGSMDRPDRLGLVKESLAILVDELDRDDTVAIVTYSDSSGIVLEPTSVEDRRTILDAIDALGPGGSTNLEAGLITGYDLAWTAFNDGGINRVVLASDGIANVGLTDGGQLAERIERDADRGIDLVTVGFGMDGFNDELMEQLANRGDGFYAYVDTEDEAERLFEDELVSTLLTVAKNAKIQVEFDADMVESYRLIGFENRAVRDDDFRNDGVDAGELGAGHQVTALYEVRLARGVDPEDRASSSGDLGDDLGTVMLRWEEPDSGDVIEIDTDIDLRDITSRWTDTELGFRVATVAATWAELLRENPYADDVDIEDLVIEVDRLVGDARDRDIDELAELIERSEDLLR